MSNPEEKPILTSRSAPTLSSSIDSKGGPPYVNHIVAVSLHIIQ